MSDKMLSVLRIDYKDQGMDIIDKINVALEITGYQFVDDGLAHDGCCLYTLVQGENHTKKGGGVSHKSLKVRRKASHLRQKRARRANRAS